MEATNALTVKGAEPDHHTLLIILEAVPRRGATLESLRIEVHVYSGAICS